MEHLIIKLMNYSMIFLIAAYSYFSFLVYRLKDKNKEKSIYNKMTWMIFLIHLLGHLAMYLQLKSEKIIYLYIFELILFISLTFVYEKFYKNLSKTLLRNMTLLLAIGFIVQLRLSIERAEKQLFFAAIGCTICLIIPKLIDMISSLDKLGWIYGVAGIGLLVAVLVFGATYYGATNWLEIKGHTFQPSEFVKILFVFSIASMFSKSIDFFTICVTGVMAAANVLILVLQRDLGGALIFYITFIIMLYLATNKAIYFFSGLLAGSAAAFIAYELFSHVRVRVLAWQNPLGLIENEGWQISQSLFAIGTGGWLGMGLNQGTPTSIPVVDSDFVFSAIAEEFGGFFAICLILIYINTFLMMITTAFKHKDEFYRLLSLGFAIMFSFQTFLSIGGVIKLIPSTGVTLPLISYGGSSMLATIVVFMIVQGIYIRANNDGALSGRKI